MESTQLFKLMEKKIEKKENDKQRISNGLCDYFSNIGKKCAEDIPKSRNSPEFYMNSIPNPNSSFFYPTNRMKICQILQTFKPKKSAGNDGISMSLLKTVAHECSIPLTILVNR